MDINNQCKSSHKPYLFSTAVFEKQIYSLPFIHSEQELITHYSDQKNNKG